MVILRPAPSPDIRVGHKIGLRCGQLDGFGGVGHKTGLRCGQPGRFGRVDHKTRL